MNNSTNMKSDLTETEPTETERSCSYTNKTAKLETYQNQSDKDSNTKIDRSTNQHRIVTEKATTEGNKASHPKAPTLQSGVGLHPILINNLWINEVLDDWERPIEDRLEELRVQRKVLIKAGYPTKDVTLAIRHLNRLYAPQQLILNQCPYQLFLTINCCKTYPDHIVLDKLNQILIRVNDTLYRNRRNGDDAGFFGFGVMEKESKPQTLPESEHIITKVTVSHWHFVLAHTVQTEVLDANRLKLAIEKVLENSSINQIESTLCDKYGLLLRDEYNRVLTEPVFDPNDVDVSKLATDSDNRNVARYMTKNLFRGQNTNEQCGVGLYHFNRGGLIKVH